MAKLRNTSGLAPLTPASSATDFTNKPADSSTPQEPSSKRSQAERDLHFIRQQFEHDSARWKQLHTICLKANRQLERNLTDLRRQIEDLRSAAISNLAAGMRQC